MALRPDESLRIYKKNQRLVILSVAEKNGVRIGTDEGYWNLDPTSFPKGVFIFAEKVTVTSASISAHNGLTVATWNLVGPRGGKKDVNFTLDASGIPGSSGGTLTSDGLRGGNGGILGLCVQNLGNDVAKALNLLARGGNGGGTRSSKAKGGEGGKGGTIKGVFQSTYLRALSSVHRYLKKFDDKSLWKEMPLTEHHPLFVAAQTLLVVAEDLAASKVTITEIFGKLRTQLAKNNFTLDGLRDAANSARDTLIVLIKEQHNYIVRDIDHVRGGSPGAGINVDAPPGEMGKNGESQISCPFSMEGLVDVPLPFVHPEQCAMLLERANTFLYIGSDSLRIHATMLYQRILRRLAFLPLLKPTHKLYEVYKYYEAQEIMPPNSLKCLERIGDSARAQLTRLSSSKTDFYGRMEHWVPRGSYTEYESSLRNAFADLKFFEDAYMQYHSALEKQEDLTNAVRIASQKTSRRLAALEKHSERLWDELQDLEATIARAQSSIDVAQTELKAAYKAEESRIKTAFGLSVLQIMDVLKDVAMAPGKGMATLAAGELLYRGFTSIPKSDGTSVTKEHLSMQFKKSEATVMDISLKLKGNADGTYTPLKEESRERLVVEKQKMLDQLDEFSKTAFGGVDDEATRNNLEAKFKAYIQVVTDRNEYILQYNLHVNDLSKNAQEKRKYKDMQMKCEDIQITQQNPDLVDITDYISSLYHSSRSRVMELLNILLRALSFRMLRPRDFVDFFSTSSDHPDDVPLGLTCIELTQARSNIEKSFHEWVEEWGSNPQRFPINCDVDQGLCYQLTDGQQRDLITKHSVTLTISKESAIQFKGLCNVRINRVRFRITGLKTASGVDGGVLVSIKLTHNGEETILGRQSNPFHFQHDAVSTTYAFRLYNANSIAVVDGNIGEAQINQVASPYARIGPFAEWKVEFVGVDVDKLDFTGVTGAYFDFCGTCYTALAAKTVG